MTVLVLFISTAAVLIFSKERELLSQQYSEQAQQELELIGALTLDAVLKHDYATIEVFITDWGEKHQEVQELEAVFPNSFTLAKYSKKTPSNSTIQMEHMIKLRETDLLNLIIVKDLTRSEKEFSILRKRFIGSAIIFIILLGFILWKTLEQTAMLPLEKEINERRLAEKKLADAYKELKATQSMMLQTQKLESVGQLAAGIAHEINTPVQYVGSNFQFLAEAFEDLKGVIEKFQTLLTKARKDSFSTEYVAQLELYLEEIDLEYILEEIPETISQSTHGIQRISSIVRAMKEFSHPGEKEKTPTDLNHLIENTITVAGNEWKYLADVVKNFDPDLPHVSCLSDEIGQVVLNLLINAAHAISAKIGLNPDGEKGTITISTNHDEGWVEMKIADTGSGIPQKARTKIFDPFFTTKEVGRGTGQGLAISYNVITEKHKGSITFETTSGVGTVFLVRLPISST